MIEIGCTLPNKTMKMGKDMQLEEAVFCGLDTFPYLVKLNQNCGFYKVTAELYYVSRCHQLVIPSFLFTGPILKAKAIDLYTKLTESRGESGPMKDFVASDGWLWRFSKRHGIRQLSLQGEKLPADKPAADNFIITFQDFVETNCYTLNQIFNCDETGLYYKLLPKKTLASHFEKCANGRKSQKEKVTINACSNALGTIKLPLLFIGKAKNPWCFKNVRRDSLPVIYRNQSNAWVNTEIFANWFHTNFVPVVSQILREMGVEPKAVLLLDNCSAHPNEDELVSSDGKIKANFYLLTLLL